jgi:hypothetical protein
VRVVSGWFLGISAAEDDASCISRPNTHWMASLVRKAKTLAAGSGPRRRKPKATKSVRQWFIATMTRDGSAFLLEPKRGCRRITTEIPVDASEAITEGELRDPNARLVANIGDHLMLGGPGADDIAIAEVVAVKSSGWNDKLIVTIVGGHIEGKRVQVLRTKLGRSRAA